MSDIEKQIIEAYVFLRKNNQSIPDSTLDYIKHAALNYNKLQAENAELKKQNQWISGLVNGHSDWVIGEKAIAINFESDEPYAFEIEWDGDCWCSIGGEEFTHWMPLPTPPEGE